MILSLTIKRTKVLKTMMSQISQETTMMMIMGQMKMLKMKAKVSVGKKWIGELSKKTKKMRKKDRC
jgi:hypothetical protein